MKLKNDDYHLTTFLLATYFIFCFCDVFFLFAAYLERIGIPSGKTGFLVSSFFIATTLVRPASGWLTERLGARKTVLLAALLTFFGSLILTVSGTSMSLILISRLLTGMGYGTYMVALTTLQCMVFPDEIRGSAFAWTAIGSIASIFTVMPLCEYLVRTGHYSLYLWTAPGLILLALLAARNLPQAKHVVPEEGDTSASWGTLLATPSLKTLLVCALFFAVPDAAITYLANLAASMDLVGSFFMIPVSLAALAMRTWGRMIPDILPRRWLAAPSFGLMSLALMGTSLAGSNIHLVIWGTLFGIGVGLGYPVLFSLVGDLLPGPLRAKGTALVYLAQDICWMGIPLLLGLCQPLLGLPLTFRILSTLSIASAVGVQWMWSRKSGTPTTKSKNQTIGG